MRIVRDGDLPLHFEAAPLKPAVVAVGWPVAILACAAGVLPVRAGRARQWSKRLPPFLALVGSSLVVGLVRCRRYEITVGQTHDRAAGRARFAASCRWAPWKLQRPVRRRAGGGSFADRELELTLSVSAQKTIVPTNNPDELRAALRMANPGTETETGTETGPPPRLAGEKSEIRNPKPEIQGRMGGNS